MRINVWVVLIVLIALFAVTRLLRYHQDTQRICADDPSASVWVRASRSMHPRSTDWLKVQEPNCSGGEA